jgi:hypothetical protein
MKLQVNNRAHDEDDDNHFVRLNPVTLAKLFEEALFKASSVDAEIDSCWNVYQEDPKNIQFLPLCIKSDSCKIFCSYNGGYFPEGTCHYYFSLYWCTIVEILSLLMNTFFKDVICTLMNKKMLPSY